MEGYKTGWSWDLKTGELIGPETVWLEKATGTYPCAGNVTFKEPPSTGEHETAVWNQGRGDWDVVPDFRGMPWWNADGTLGGIVEELGDNGRITIEPPHLEIYERLEWKNGAWEKKLKEGWIKDKATGEAREMTQVEKIYAGLEEVPEGCKIEDGVIVAKSMAELYDDGKVTLDEYNEYIRHNREIEYRLNTDKIGLMVLRGEATKEEWEDAILAVKVKWPYKEA